MKLPMILAVFFGATAYLLDALIAHGPKSFFGGSTDLAQRALATATHYQLLAAIFLLVLVAIYQHIPSLFVLFAQLLVTVGVFCFCGPIYLKYLIGSQTLSFLTPLGGIAFMLAFLSLLPLVVML